jgi:hypothetical protein
MASAAGSRTSGRRPKRSLLSARPLSAADAPGLAGYWQLHPVEATHAGARGYDALTPDLSPSGLAARRDSFSTVDLSALDSLDRQVLRGELAFQQVMQDMPRRAPAFYLEQAMNGVHFLLARGDPDAALETRLAAVPRLLQEGQANLVPNLVPPEFVEIALVAADGALRFLAELPGDTAAAQQAVTDFATFLRRDLRPEGTFALGHEAFERLLRETHGLTMTPDDVYDHGRALADELLGKLGPSWQADVEALKADHPTRDSLLHTYADEAARARAFVEAHHLVPIPPGERFEVRPTAPFLRATTPLGHFDKTPPFDPEDNLGVLYITPIDPALPEARQQELLSAHCHTAVRAICLHETFPGHHVQLWHAKLHGSAIRRQFPSSLFTEGWALYCEELMEEAGYYDSPGLKLWRLKNALWRAARLMVDVGLHCRGLSLESAAEPLMTLGGLEPNTARGEALRYTTSPTQPSSYVLGRDRIVALRRAAEQRLGAAFELSAFHARLLTYGSVSPAFIPDEL